ncbi:hypothetical protein [Metamycoplasma hyosynoviae]|uniref:hypothetical protein n=1 Tax=Metamycoplasma hyosynoviae TaxID=29559 RepID=UPI000461C1B3|nr:hypothetical protein [Metamycoplasma hyosynoviae]KDE43551.1 hypothetical protein NPL1_00390 [Metamycoplasma hyosynoviae]MDC8900531.1 hypothetical protein [Metamycoplasma hyosynoviae]MDC8911864.1 hypothetical protein [Metamycoplasma hyosynoviae]MDC8937944.1 hypothetical protein [Metamycoplasma hyosynoviae]MDD1366370.1 hypothetical protein [Metamycoplasma hyosynoviae]
MTLKEFFEDYELDINDFEDEQIEKIQQGLEEKLDVSWHSNQKYDYQIIQQMCKILETKKADEKELWFLVGLFYFLLFGWFVCYCIYYSIHMFIIRKFIYQIKKDQIIKYLNSLIKGSY